MQNGTALLQEFYKNTKARQLQNIEDNRAFEKRATELSQKELGPGWWNMFKQESKFNKSEARIDGRLSLVRSATIA